MLIHSILSFCQEKYSIMLGISMAYTLSFNTLPENLQDWQGLPLSLSGCEVMPLDYHAGKIGWILYGKTLNKSLLSLFQKQLAMPIVIVSSWQVDDFQIARIAGSAPKKAFNIAASLNIDIASIDSLPSLHSRGLMVMDIDSMAITIESLAKITKQEGLLLLKHPELRLSGNMDFTVRLRQAAAALKETDIAVLNENRRDLSLISGLRFLVQKLKEHHWHMVIISNGFTYFSEYLKEQLEFSQRCAAEPDIPKGKHSGLLYDPVMDPTAKIKILHDLMGKLNIPLSQTVVIGNSANNIKMMRTAALGVAYHATEKITEKVKIHIKFADLTGLYCILSASLDSQG